MKVPVHALGPVRHALEASGGHLEQALTLEDNLVLDDLEGSLRTSGRLLRIRRWGDQWTVTFKGVCSFRDGIKSRPETETSLGDGSALLTMMAELGISPVRRYQKRRETWQCDGVVVALDETPMGCFVELEGDPEHLADLAGHLGLDPGAAVSGTYLELWNRYRETHPEAPAEMVFL
jgi:adenylate cyclase, class 2